MVDRDARRCIADLCSALELVIKMLLELGPVAAAVPKAMSKYAKPLGDNLALTAQSAKHLGGFVALQDALRLLGQVKEKYGLPSEHPRARKRGERARRVGGLS
jgi:hypothetical protein